MYQQYKTDLEKPTAMRDDAPNIDVGSGNVASEQGSQVKQSTQQSQEDEWPVESVIKEQWLKQQEELKQNLIIEDVTGWAQNHLTYDSATECQTSTPLRYIGGVDISFVKGDLFNACAALVILEYPSLEVVYEDMSLVRLTAPYIAGFLAFREAQFFIDKVNRLRSEKPELEPQVIVVDGNGIHHPQGFGLACHMGVLLGIPTIGAAKNFLVVDGLEKDASHNDQIGKMTQAGDSFPLVGASGKVVGMAVRTSDRGRNPMYISPGHMVSMDTAVWVTQLCSRYRVPEPTRQADIRSREYLRKHWPVESAT